jgi:glutamate mutase epsilon subunit
MQLLKQDMARIRCLANLALKKLMHVGFCCYTLEQYQLNAWIGGV